MYKVVTLCALLAAANAGPTDHQATSFVSFNDNHNSVQHIQSAPIVAKYAAPASHQYASPAYAAPSVAKIAIPVVAKIAAPAASSYYNAPATKYSAPIHVAPVIAKYAAAPSYVEKEDQYGPAKYEFAYIIQDPHTGDYHSQEEKRDGEHIIGQYSLHEADGTIRLVKYSDDGHGFNAVVERQGHPNEAPVAFKKIAVPQYSNHY